MKKTGLRLTGLAAGAFLYAVAVPAFAQDDAATAAKKAPPTPDKNAKAAVDETAPAANKPKSDREAAVTTVDTWESFAGEPETLEETFFRLSQDFIISSEDGFHRLGSVPVWPRGELKILGFRMLPYLREAVEFDNNYYQQAGTGPSSADHGHSTEWTHVNEIGILADKLLAGGRLQLSGMIDSVWNIHYNNVQDTWDVNAQVGATYTWPSGLWISGGLGYERRHDPTDLPAIGNDFGRDTKNSFLTFGADRDIFFGSKCRFEFGVQSTNPVAQSDAFSDMDRTETVVFGKVSYPFIKETTRIFLLVDHRWDNRESDAINDGKAYGMHVGLEGSIPLRSGEYRGLKGQISIGFDSALYDNDKYQHGSDTLIADSNREATTANILVALQYTMSPKSTADLRYLHQSEFSFYGNYQIVDRVDATFTHSFSRQLTGRAGAFYEHVAPSGNNPAESIPSDNISKDAAMVNREGIGIGLRYAINEWMDVDFSTDIENRNDHTDKSYRAYRAIVGLTFFLNALAPKARTPVTR